MEELWEAEASEARKAKSPSLEEGSLQMSSKYKCQDETIPDWDGPKSKDGYPCKRQKQEKTRRKTGTSSREDRGRAGGDAGTSQAIPEAGKVKKAFSSGAFRGRWSCQRLDFRLLASRAMTEPTPVVLTPYFVTAALGDGCRDALPLYVEDTEAVKG